MASTSFLRTLWFTLVLPGLLFAMASISVVHNVQTPAAGSGPLKVSENGRYFVKDGGPFFWLGDTTWSLVNQYTKEEAEFYLEYRRKQGFTVEHVMPL